MNYEFEIQKLDLELRHMREMQAIYRERVDAHEQGLEHTGTRLAAVESALETVAVDLKVLTTNVNALVAALLREHKNGGAK